ncbi:hypothetical protein GXW82_18580 [Streptacidiphilus sp. 4-A2]|nr:hypothetical protein [Streptacidiphilus sp. 4-A2]
MGHPTPAGPARSSSDAPRHRQHAGRTARRLAVLTFRDLTDPAAFRAQLDRLRRTARRCPWLR